MQINPVKPERGRIDLTTDALVRHWTKRLGASKDEIVAAIEKVGNNPETVRKELSAMNSKGLST